MFQPLLFDVLRGPLPDSYRLPEHVGPDQAADYYLDQLDQLLSEHQQQIAAVIVEPLVQGAAGMVMHPPGFLAGVRRLTRQYGLLMIADEVAVGFGRTGTMFACQQEQVSPDLLCLGKGLSGGYLAMAATLASSEIFEAFLGSGDASRTFYHGHTYGGNPLAAAAALASLEVFSEEQTLARLPAKIELLADQLKPLWNLPLVGDIRQCGLLAAIELVADKETRQPLPAAEQTGARVCQLAQQQGVWLRPLRDVLVVMPPLSVSDEQICRIVDTLAAAIAEIGQKVDIEQGGGRG
jgi:adenosylmethionine-8-amino-7-oxononanoate aminotransferase